MLALTPLVIQLIELGIEVAPDIIAAVRREIALVSATNAPNAADQALIDRALEEANAALQAARQAPA